MPDRTEYLTAAQAAEVAKVSEVTIRKWVKVGRIVGDDSAGKLMILVSSLEGLEPRKRGRKRGIPI